MMVVRVVGPARLLHFSGIFVGLAWECEPPRIVPAMVAIAEGDPP